MQVAALATGGKDSVLAIYHALKTGYDVKCLATMIPLKEDSWMFHYPNIGLIDLFAEALGIPVVKAETNAVKEEEVEDLKHLIEKLDVEGLVSGAIASTYQKTRIEKICNQLGLKSITPLWRKNPLDILEELLDLKIEPIITGAYAYGFSEEWLGRKIDEATIADLIELNRKYGTSFVGEGGEYETFVLDAPIFKKKIQIVKSKKIWKNESGHLQIIEAVLKDK